MSLLLAVVTFVHQLQREDKQDSEAATAAREAAEANAKLQRALESLLAFQAAQQQTLDRLEQEQAKQPYCVVRESPLRAARRVKSQRVGEVFEGDIVEVGRRRGRFVQVWYFDPLEQVLRNGWIAKKCLARIGVVGTR